MEKLSCVDCPLEGAQRGMNGSEQEMWSIRIATIFGAVLEAAFEAGRGINLESITIQR